MTYRVVYSGIHECWVVEHWAWLDHGYGGGPWVVVSRQPSELDALRYVREVQQRQRILMAEHTRRSA